MQENTVSDLTERIKRLNHYYQVSTKWEMVKIWWKGRNWMTDLKFKIQNSEKDYWITERSTNRASLRCYNFSADGNTAQTFEY